MDSLFSESVICCKRKSTADMEGLGAWIMDHIHLCPDRDLCPFPSLALVTCDHPAFLRWSLPSPDNREVLVTNSQDPDWGTGDADPCFVVA